MAFRSYFFSPCQLSESAYTLAVVRNSLRLCKTYSSNGGARAVAPTTSREQRMQRTAFLRRNRRDPELERAARTGSLSVPLDQVQSEWRCHRGLDQLLRAGHHFNIYQDLYAGRVFRPQGFMEVTYDGGKTVHRGTILSPTEASQPPRVSGLPREGLCSLVLSNPDGHLLHHSMELLHWMILNISGGVISSGQEVVPYLQPVPPQGSGLHRFIFSLFTHPAPITTARAAYRHGDLWLDRRTFSSAEFLSSHPSLQPFTFSLFQSQWDSSVHSTYMEDLVYPEPVYGVQRELTPRRQRQQNTQILKANHYRLYS